MLVQANLGLVWRVARQYEGRGMLMEDLVGEGNLGLIRAAEEFDPDFGVRFSTYATYWIKQSILSALMSTTTTIRVPAHMFRLLVKWGRAEGKLGRASGRRPSAEEVASELGLSEHQKRLVTQALRAQGLRLENGRPAGPCPWPGDAMRDSREGPGALLEAVDERERLRQRLGRLDSHERAVVVLRYGLGGETPLTFSQIGRRLKLSREGVRQVMELAFQRLVDGFATPQLPLGDRRPNLRENPRSHDQEGAVATSDAARGFIPPRIPASPPQSLGKDCEVDSKFRVRDSTTLSAYLEMVNIHFEF